MRKQKFDLYIYTLEACLKMETVQIPSRQQCGKSGNMMATIRSNITSGNSGSMESVAIMQQHGENEDLQPYSGTRAKTEWRNVVSVNITELKSWTNGRKSGKHASTNISQNETRQRTTKYNTVFFHKQSAQLVHCVDATWM